VLLVQWVLLAQPGQPVLLVPLVQRVLQVRLALLVPLG
jgi:hypothetical protein